MRPSLVFVLVLLVAGCGRSEGPAAPGEPAWNGMSLTQWLILFNSAKPENVTAAAVALQKIGPPAIQGLGKALATTQDNYVRSEAARVLGAFGAPAAPALAEALGHESLHVRTAAREAVVKMGPPAVPALIAALTGPDPLRMEVLGALERLGPPAAAACDVLRKIQDDPDRKIRYWAKRALEKVCP
jgi:HEAT repeat protein